MGEPRTPEEIPEDTPLDVLAGRWYEHGRALLLHHCDLVPLDDAERAGHALAQLAYAAALAGRALAGQWVCAVEALDAGAGHRPVAAALGLDLAEFHTGLSAWAGHQLRFGLIDPERHARVMDLLDAGLDEGDRTGGDPR